jgi:hypothetical protein
MECIEKQQYKSMNQEENAFFNDLVNNLEFNKIQSFKKAKEYLRIIGSSLSGDIYISDPYLNEPQFIEDLILSSNELKTVHILFDLSYSKLSQNEITDRFIEFCVKNNLTCKFILKSTDLSSIIPFHDRFILSRERGWIFGTSFNYFGNRQSYVVDIDYFTLIKKLDPNFAPKFTKSHFLRIHFNDIWDLIKNYIICEAPNDIQF